MRDMCKDTACPHHPFTNLVLFLLLQDYSAPHLMWTLEEFRVLHSTLAARRGTILNWTA